jgi:SAM-dependent methyltransferase
MERTSGIIDQVLPERKARILEIGCASGDLLRALKDKGYVDLFGVDPSPQCAAIARRLHNVRATQGTLRNIGADGALYDVVILIGVLEHVRDLTEATKKLVSLLSENGTLLIAVPDASRYAQGEDAPFQEFSVEHINYFGPVSLGNLFAKHGCSEIKRVQVLLECNHRTTTPVLYSFFKKTSSPPALAVDGDTPRELAAYVEQCTKADKEIHAKIGRLVANGRPIVVWGTGAHTRRLLATSGLSEARIRAFVDSNPKYQGQELKAVPVVSPKALFELPDDPIVVSSRVFQKEIVATIKETMKLANEVVTLYDV